MRALVHAQLILPVRSCCCWKVESIDNHVCPSPVPSSLAQAWGVPHQGGAPVHTRGSGPTAVLQPLAAQGHALPPLAAWACAFQLRCPCPHSHHHACTGALQFGLYEWCPSLATTHAGRWFMLVRRLNITFSGIAW